MQNIIQKLRDFNRLSNNLPLHIMIQDDEGGFLINSLDEVVDDFGDLKELDESLNRLIDEVAMLHQGV